jgi:hypothetical protein
MDRDMEKVGKQTEERNRFEGEIELAKGLE